MWPLLATPVTKQIDMGLNVRVWHTQLLVSTSAVMQVLMGLKQPSEGLEQQQSWKNRKLQPHAPREWGSHQERCPDSLYRIEKFFRSWTRGFLQSKRPTTPAHTSLLGPMTRHSTLTFPWKCTEVSKAETTRSSVRPATRKTVDLPGLTGDAEVGAQEMETEFDEAPQPGFWWCQAPYAFWFVWQVMRAIKLISSLLDCWSFNEHDYFFSNFLYSCNLVKYFNFCMGSKSTIKFNEQKFLCCQF